MKFIAKLILIMTTLLLAMSNSYGVNQNANKDNATIEYLNEVFDANKNFKEEHPNEFFSEFKNTQSPKSTHLGCSDSRVHMLSHSPTPQNEVFVIRNIGNQLITSEGSIDYGVQVLNTPYLVIVGHSGCGAVEASLAKITTEIPAIDEELSTLKLSSKDLNDAIIENVNTQVSIAINKYESKIASGELVVFGMIYDFRNDFSKGKGSLILTNVNGLTSPEEIKQTYSSKVANIQYLSD